MAITIMQRWLFKRGSADPGATQLSPRLMNVGQVREALVTSALLQLPFSMPKHEKMDRVDGIITELVRAGWQGSGLYPGMSAQTPCRCTACMSARTLCRVTASTSSAQQEPSVVLGQGAGSLSASRCRVLRMCQCGGRRN